MADTLNIEPYMIKEILCREAADYEQHIEVVKKYIEDNFCPFDEFLEYVSKNFTYKMPRYIAVDDNYAALLTSFIKYSSTKSKVLSKTNCKATSYKTLFQYPTDDKYKPLIKATKTFLEKNNIKFQLYIVNHYLNYILEFILILLVLSLKLLKRRLMLLVPLCK
jgi:hypothetical protein